MDRNANLYAIRQRVEPWDIAVIGGGATGVGCALDAAARGYTAVVLEQHDLGKGTSSRSTKLIHGGVRYLRQGDIALVRESLRERGRLIRNAPHVVHRQAFVIPCYSVWQKYFYWAGLKAYDLLAGKYSLGRSQFLSRDEVISRLPAIKSTGLVGGVLYYDGQFDDTRLLIDLAETATERGAVILNYAKVTSMVKNADGSVNGVAFTDTLTGETFEIAARSVINAAGAFSDEIRAMSDRTAAPVVTFSQGVHLVFDASFLPGGDAVMIPETTDGRILFCIPWHGHTLVGTTDTPVDKAELEPTALETEIDFILETAAGYLARPPRREDIQSVFAGIRPLINDQSKQKTANISRGHDLFIDASGLVTITGGKWTTYRRMAEDAIDKAAEIAKLDPRACVTEELQVIDSTHTITQPADRLHDKLPYTRDNVEHAVHTEMAVTLEDVLARRTRALFLDAAAAIEIADETARVMARELGKDETWVREQVEAFSLIAKNYLPQKQQ